MKKILLLLLLGVSSITQFSCGYSTTSTKASIQDDTGIRSEDRIDGLAEMNNGILRTAKPYPSTNLVSSPDSFTKDNPGSTTSVFNDKIGTLDIAGTVKADTIIIKNEEGHEILNATGVLIDNSKNSAETWASNVREVLLQYSKDKTERIKQQILSDEAKTKAALDAIAPGAFELLKAIVIGL